MADARAKRVLDALIDLSTKPNYLIDIVSDLREPLGRGDTVEIPNIGNLTVAADGSVSTTPQALAPSILSLVADRHPMISVDFPKVALNQIMDGAWANQVAFQALSQLKNQMDVDMVDYLRSVIVPTFGALTNQDNLAASGTDLAALTPLAITRCIAGLETLTGSVRSNFAWILHPFAVAELTAIAAFIPNMAQAEMGNLGMPMLGSLYGIPVFGNNAVPRRRTVASTAWAVATNVETVTVGAGHGIVPGQFVTFATPTAGGVRAANALVTSVTATTVVFGNTVANANATEAGTLTVQGIENMLIDRTHVYVAQQLVPELEMVKATNTSGWIGQFTSIWGRIARPGRVRCLNTRADPS